MREPSAIRYRTEPKRLLLDLLLSDPWTQERPLALALYAKAGKLARDMGAREVLARSVLHADDYRHEAWYRRRHPGGWCLETILSPYRRKELADGGWRRVAALLSVLTTPPFQDFRGTWRETDGSRPR